MDQDKVRKDTHLPEAEMKKLLDKIGRAGIREAMKAWAQVNSDPNLSRFRPARSWVVLDSDKNKYPHRPLVALACKLANLRVLEPNNFGLPNDEVCKRWFEENGIEWQSVE
jgi:hypothetical protein